MGDVDDVGIILVETVTVVIMMTVTIMIEMMVINFCCFMLFWESGMANFT